MNKRKDYLLPMMVIGMLFLVFGVVTWVNAVLIPYFKIGLELNNTQAGLVAFATYISYFVFAIPCSGILKKTGYRKGFVIGLITMTVGSLLFIPAALTRVYSLFLIALFIVASGMVLLQTAANPYVAIVGPQESTAQRMGIMGVANRFAGILTQIILGGILLNDSDSVVTQLNTVNLIEKEEILSNFMSKVINPYIFLALFFIVVAVLILFVKIPELNDAEVNKVEGKRVRNNIFSFPYLILGVLAIFFAGVSSLSVNGIIIYGNALNIPFADSRYYSQFALSATLIGFVMTSVIIPKFISQRAALITSSFIGLSLTALSYFSTGPMSAYFLLSMGFLSAFNWGTIWGLSIRNLGAFTKLGSALLLMGLAGAGTAPIIFGKLIDINPIHPQNALFMFIPSFLYLFWFGVYGSKMENWSFKKYMINS